jgi:hypothetical protein
MSFDFIRMFHVRSLHFPLLSALVMVVAGVGNAHATISMTLLDGNSNSLSCQANAITQDAAGILTVDEPTCLGSIDSTGTSLRFLVSGSLVGTGCVFSSMDMSSAGDVVLTASDACIVVQPLVFTLQDDRFALNCEADTLLQNDSGVLSLSNVSCINDIDSQTQTASAGIMSFTDAGTSRSCQFGNMSLDANGSLILTATGDCFGDTDDDGIPNPIDPDPNQGPVVAADCGPQPDAVGGKQSSIILGDGVNAEIADVTCYLPNAPERVIAANSVLGASNYPINVDFYAKEQVVLFEGTALKGNSTMSIQSDVQTQPVVRIWGPFTVEAGSVFKVHPAPTLN